MALSTIARHEATRDSFGKATPDNADAIAKAEAEVNNSIKAYENLKARDEKRLATATKEANSSQKANNKKVKDATALLARHFNGYLQDFSAEIEAIKLGMSINQDSLARRTQQANEYERSERDAGNARAIAEQKRQAIRFAAAIGVKIEIATFDEAFEKAHNLQENHADYSPNAQGLYTDGVLYINERYIDPTSQSAMFVTIKHELSHFIETNSSAYQAMLRFTKGYLRSQGMDFSVIAAQKTADYLQEGIALTPAQVESEVVAMVNSEILLNDPQAVAAFVSDAPNVAQRFWTRLKDIISNYGKVRPDKQILAGNAMFKAAFQNAKAVGMQTDTPWTINDTEQTALVEDANVDTATSTEYNKVKENDLYADTAGSNEEGIRQRQSDGRGREGDTLDRISENARGITQVGLSRQGDSRTYTDLLSKYRDRLTKLANPVPNFGLSALDQSQESRQKYCDALDLMRSENPEGASVDPKTPDELTGATVLLDSDKTAGAAVKDDGYLTGVFKSNKRNKTKNAIGELTLLAIANGATHGDCYGAFLMNAYARYGGFVPVARVAYVRGFNPRMDAYVDAQRAKGKRGFATDPDIYFMVRPSEITVESVVDALENDTFKQYTIDELNALPLMEYGEAEALVENMLKKQATAAESAADTATPSTETTASTSTEAASTEPAVDDTSNYDRSHSDWKLSVGMSFGEMKQKYEALVKTYGSINPQSASPVPKQTSPTMKTSKFAQNASDNLGMNEQVRNEGFIPFIIEEGMSYVPLSNAKTMDSAQKSLDNLGLEAIANKLSSDVKSGTITVHTIAEGELALVAASKAGDVEMVQRIMSDLAIAAKESGRSVQAFSMLKRMSPAGKLYYAEQMAKHLNSKYSKTNGNGLFEITDAERTALLNAQNTEEADAIIDVMTRRWGQEIPLTVSERLRTWRYLAMLGNVRTYLRNIVGNVRMGGIVRIKDIVGAGLEAADVARGKMQQGERTKAVGRIDADVKQYSLDAFNEYKDDIVSGSRYDERSAEAYKRYFKTKALDSTARFVFNAMETADGWSLKRRFTSAFAQQIKARGLDINSITTAQRAEMARWAITEAQKATFRDASTLANALNKWSKNKAVGWLVEGVVPFKKTPINILKRSYEYSPAGIIKGFVELNKSANNGTVTRARAIDSLASGITGTTLLALGLYAASLGFIGSGSGDDEYEKYRRGLGHYRFEANVFGMSVDLSAFAPTSVPLFLGASLWNVLEDGADLSDIGDVISMLTEIADPLTEMSVLSGVQSLLEDISYAEDGQELSTIATSALSSLASQFVPTAIGQVTRAFDPYARDYSTSGKSFLGKDIEYVGKTLLNKTPLELTSNPRVNLKGEREKNADYGNFGKWLLNFANQTILPAGVKLNTKSDVDIEIMRLFEATLDESIVPTKPSRKIQVYGKKYTMSNDEYTQYQETVGTAVYSCLTQLVNSAEYSLMNDAQRAEAISSALTQAQKAVKDYYVKQKESEMSAAGKWID